MGLRSSTGISDPIQRKPTFWNTLSTFSPAPDKENRGNVKMWGYPGGNKPTRRLTSNVFLVPPKKWGLATNNKFKSSLSVCGKATFQDVCTLKDIICRRDYMVELNLKNAYFSVPVADSDRKYLRFE